MNKMIGIGSPCIICREPNGYLKNKLLRIEDLCSSASDDRHGVRAAFNWGIHTRCRYGMPCTKLDLYERECRSIADRIEKRIVDAIHGDGGMYRRIYELCRGDFPQVCWELERIKGKLSKADNTADAD